VLYDMYDPLAINLILQAPKDEPAAMEWMQTEGRQKLVTLAERALDVMEAGAPLTRASRPSRRRRLR
jgi:hypothetical protein